MFFKWILITFPFHIRYVRNPRPSYNYIDFDPKLSERGWIEAIAERISKNEIDSQDMQVLMGDVRGKMFASHHVQTQDLSRGGRRV